jgi:hypothetical protein
LTSLVAPDRRALRSILTALALLLPDHRRERITGPFSNGPYGRFFFCFSTIAATSSNSRFASYTMPSLAV